MNSSDCESYVDNTDDVSDIDDINENDEIDEIDDNYDVYEDDEELEMFVEEQLKAKREREEISRITSEVEKQEKEELVKLSEELHEKDEEEITKLREELHMSELEIHKCQTEINEKIRSLQFNPLENQDTSTNHDILNDLAYYDLNDIDAEIDGINPAYRANIWDVNVNMRHYPHVKGSNDSFLSSRSMSSKPIRNYLENTVDKFVDVKHHNFEAMPNLPKYSNLSNHSNLSNLSNLSNIPENKIQSSPDNDATDNNLKYRSYDERNKYEHNQYMKLPNIKPSVMENLMPIESMSIPSRFELNSNTNIPILDDITLFNIFKNEIVETLIQLQIQTIDQKEICNALRVILKKGPITFLKFNGKSISIKDIPMLSSYRDVIMNIDSLKGLYMDDIARENYMEISKGFENVITSFKKLITYDLGVLIQEDFHKRLRDIN